MLKLKRTYCRPDLTCPHCNKQIEVKWSTEYGDPINGDYTEECPYCSKRIEFTVEAVVEYVVKNI